MTGGLGNAGAGRGDRHRAAGRVDADQRCEDLRGRMTGGLGNAALVAAIAIVPRVVLMPTSVVKICEVG